MSQSKSIKFWNKAAPRYTKAPIRDKEAYARSLEFYRSYLSPSDRMLELGCGSGGTSRELASGVASILATDISEEMIKAAQQTPVPNIEYRTATAETLSRADGPFDVVLGCNYLHLVDDLPTTLTQIHDLLRPGGMFLSKTPCIALHADDRGPCGKDRKGSHDPDLHRRASDPRAGARRVVEKTAYHSSKAKDIRPVIAARRV